MAWHERPRERLKPGTVAPSRRLASVGNPLRGQVGNVLGFLGVTAAVMLGDLLASLITNG